MLQPRFRPPSPSLTPLATHLLDLRSRLERACATAGRATSDVRLVGVTKTVEPSLAADLFRLGVHDLGESRVQVLAAKVEHFESLGLDATWHMIGHLQRNKARRAVLLADEIHSVGSAALLETLERIAGEEGRRPRIWLEVKLVESETRGGLLPAELPAVFARAVACEHLDVRGLMTMAAPPPSLDDPTARQAPARAVFDALHALADSLPTEQVARCCDGRVRLSMGMTQDFEAAIAAGSHLVRVGSALFKGPTDEVRA